MLTYYLDGQRIDAPHNLDGLTLRKSRNRLYWGFLYRRLGYVANLSNMQFQQPDATGYLRAEFARYGVQAETSFRIEESGRTLYDGFIDYATWTDDGFTVSLGLRDSRAVADLEAGATTVYGLPATETIWLPTRRLGGMPSLTINPDLATVQQATASASSLNHAVPLKRLNDRDALPGGTLLDVINPKTPDPIYRNDTGKTQLVSLSGVVVVVASTSQTIGARLLITGAGDPVELFADSVSTTPKALTAVLDLTLSVEPGRTLSLIWWGDLSGVRWSFAYDMAQTRISLSDELTLPGSAAFGLTAQRAVAGLVEQATGRRLRLVSDWLTTGDGATLFLANGAGLRGVNLPISASLQALFTNLSKLFCLALWIDGDTVRIEPRSQQPRRVSGARSVTVRTERVALDFLFGAVAVGYQTWRADSLLSNDEPNGQRRYSTGITVVRNEMNLISELITGSNLIEQQRRLQFDPKTAGAAITSNLDESLFLICSAALPTGRVAETRQRAEAIYGVNDPATLFNLRLTPERTLKRWADWLTASSPLTMQSVQGNGNLVSIYDGEAVGPDTSLIPPGELKTSMLITLELPMTLDEYAGLGDTIDDQGDELPLLDAEWRQTKTGSMATLTLLKQ